MLLTRALFALLLPAIYSLSSNAQTTRSFTLNSPVHQGTITLEGNKTDLFPFVWNSGKGPQTAGVNYDYSLIFYKANDTTSPLDIISKTCCASSFADSVLNFSGEQWDGFLNGISQQIKGRDLAIGDTLDLLWRVNLSAVSFGPVYEFRQSDDDFSVRFIRGQFNEEYMPVTHKSPANFQHFFIEGDPNQNVSFSWSAAYCPSGCAAAAYDLLIDTADGNFEYPYLSVSVPNNDSTWSVSYNTLNQLLNDTKTPHGASRKVYWKVLIYGNNQVVYSQERGEFTVWNGLLNNEHEPFSLINPVNNFIINLTGQATTQLNFKWESTFTPLGNPDLYFVVFDTLGGSPVFGSPLMQFATPIGSADTALNIAYGKIDRGLDSLYPGWKEANMVWGVKARINNTYYYPNETHTILFKSGTMIGLNDVRQTLQVYPNPAKEFVLIPEKSSTRNIKLYSIQGKEMLNTTLSAGETKIELSGFPEGIYLLYIRDGENIFFDKLMISR